MTAALRLFFCDHHELPLPPGHKFPLRKYGMVRAALQGDARIALSEAPLASTADLQRVHSAAYVESFLGGTIEPAAMRRIGFPWSEGTVKRTLASAGATLAATRTALDEGMSGTLAGGTHHAFRDEGSGFCVFNDLAVSAEWARASHHVSRIAVVDVDVHQGDGTAKIFEGNADTYTLSLHGARNFPFRKQRSRVDIEFEDEVSGSEYLHVLEAALEDVWIFAPELVFYQAGVDTLETDKLGRLHLTRADLAARDRMVLQAATERAIPVVITMGGGYSDPIEATVDAHVQTFHIAAEIYSTRHGAS
jgi:acetoin utilization deacetylase AcuC-like enzyme